MINETIHNPEFKAKHRISETDFTRERSLPFHLLVLFLMNLIKNPAQTELDHFFARIYGSDLPSQVVTKAALTEARRKLKHEAFIELNDRVIDGFYQQDDIQRWHGYRILAVDGTTLRLPNTPQIVEKFKPKPGETPLARLVELYDVLNHMVIGATLSTTELGERFQAERLLPKAKVGDIVLYDRGFISFFLLALHRFLGLDYCMRTPLTQFCVVEEFVRSGELERWVDITPSAQAKRDCLSEGLSVEPIRVRLVRVELPNGEVEVLVTSLDNPIPSAFAELYFLRWGIEEGYKHQKCRAELENFSGKTVHAVYQDVFAKLLTLNLTAFFVFAAKPAAKAKTAHRKRDYAINLAAALSKMKHHLVKAIHSLATHLEPLVKWIASQTEAIRPGRQFQRKNPGRKKPGFHPCFKPNA